jgi:hypothetical protein
MAKKEYSGNSMKNARIKINYTGKKPKVTFTYPFYKKQTSTPSWLLPFMLWIVPFFLITMANTYFTDMKDMYNYEFKPYQSEESQRYTGCVEHYYFNIDRVISTTCSLYAKNSSRIYPSWNLMANSDANVQRVVTTASLKKSFRLMCWMFIPPFLIWLIFRKFWLRVSPKFYGGGRPKKAAVFKPEHFIELNGKKYFELPLFSNVRIDYEATEDFSKYMTEFEVREHPFIWFVRHRKGKEYLKRNEFLWYARWYYSQKPLKGELKAYFR